MDKLWLIIKREYLTRVKKRMFIITTLLTPLMLAAFIVVVALIMTSGKESLNVIVKDDNRLIVPGQSLADEKNVHFEADTASLQALTEKYKNVGNTAVLHIKAIPADRFMQNTISMDFYYEPKIGMSTQESIETAVADFMRAEKYRKAGYDTNLLKMIDQTTAQLVAVNASGEAKGRSTDVAVASALGFIMGLLIYLVTFVYGFGVMRSVMEEKTSRIVEVMVSSVKPFQLMLGKIIGVGAVGLTQFMIWLILIPLLNLGVGLLFAGKISAMQESMPSGGMQPGQMGPQSIDPDQISEIMNSLGNMPWFQISVVFLLFFIGGYLLYSSLFAAVGSLVGDDINESNSLTIPITIPVILSFYIGMAVIENPNSSLAKWSSMVPFFSPTVMTTRLGFKPPWWEIALSLIILYGTCILIVWLAAKIYRTGILMYGKKASWKEVGKWLFKK